ncbi:hypothetical protein Aph01nite_57960 [Acrocarpospora phusangensis]|uniref:PknH-like extracellular domain-containing protein n=1 Tax=Acrocarpospora phusangensis TaxID=1070424 RepID=A0A919QGJ7_9ACTN|nr:hypothetical protein [Acrocarpospora phusangensis]GIH27486.1 hypothetical protein Aph01nite_57960 [Acrocarpospora phusangensis]
MCVVLGCSPPPVSSPAPQAESRGAGGLTELLLTHVDGMRRVYGPEAGAYGQLHATRAGLQALGAARLDKPECRSSGQLDARAVAGAPGAVVSFATPSATASGPARTVTQAVVAADWFPGPPPAACARYTATVGRERIAYVTTPVTAPVTAPGWGQDAQGFLTAAAGGGRHTTIGSVVVRYRGVVMSLLVVGATVKQADVVRQTDLALAGLRRVMV